MAKPKSDAWIVYPHGELRQLGPRLFWVEGSLPSGHMPRTMVIYQMADGGLWLHSPVCLDEATQARVEALGPPRVILVPSAFHRLDAPRYKLRYPEARVLCPQAATAAVSQKVAVDGAADEPSAIGGGVIAHAPPGIKPGELAYELDLGPGHGPALVFNDMLMNLGRVPGLDGLLFRLVGSTGFFGMTGIGRLLMLRDRRAFAGWLRQMAERDPAVVAVSHGAPITERCGERLREAAARLA